MLLVVITWHDGSGFQTDGHKTTVYGGHSLLFLGVVIYGGHGLLILPVLDF